MKWFSFIPDHESLRSINSRNYVRYKIDNMLTDLATAEYLADIDTENFDIQLFDSIYIILHAAAHNLREVVFSPVSFISQCFIYNDNQHSQLLYITNVIYLSLMKILSDMNSFIIYDKDVYCCDQMVENYGANIVDNVTNLNIDFTEPLFPDDIKIRTYCNSQEIWKLTLYDNFFTVDSIIFIEKNSFFGRVISFYENNDVFKHQRQILQEWENRLIEKENEIIKREEEFDNDCERYEIEATKWKALQESKFKSMQEKLESEDLSYRHFIAILHTELMKYEDYNIILRRSDE